MKAEKRRGLVIGGNGMLGYSTLARLAQDGWTLRSLDIAMPQDRYKIEGVEYIVGDAGNSETLKLVMQGVDTLFFFLSTTIPGTGDADLSNEISKTISLLDKTLSTMVKVGVKRIIFPSSGGAIYGDSEVPISETAPLLPKTAYGMGKKISEDIISYYNRKYGISAIILRIGNIYGSRLYRNKPQGVIDVFIQKMLEGRPVQIWGNAKNTVRDYIHIDDVCNAIAFVTENEISGVEIYNVGTGIGSSVADVINIIEKQTGKSLMTENKPNATSGISKIVLCADKLNIKHDWSASIDLETGIKETISRKELTV